MTPRFTKFLPFIFAHECVYKKGHYGDLAFVITENVKGDAGGLTKWGIDKRSHSNVDVAKLTQAQATPIYFDEWKTANIEDFPYPFGEALFDATVNCGAGRAAKLLMITDDDARRFCDERTAFYYRLAKQKPHLKKFLKGWLARVVNLKKHLGIK